MIYSESLLKKKDYRNGVVGMDIRGSVALLGVGCFDISEAKSKCIRYTNKSYEKIALSFH